jgi:hypothetical protein
MVEFFIHSFIHSYFCHAVEQQPLTVIIFYKTYWLNKLLT